jgi:N-acetylmuramoyl-L-alanine amidase
LVVIHCTELPDLAMARVFGKRQIYPEQQTGNSGHFYIDRNGSVEQWVPLDRVAHHVRGFNPHTIGIELVNSGRYPHWFNSDQQQMTENYPQQQLTALTELLNHLQATLPGLRGICGHEDIDTDLIPAEDQPDIMIRRKLDPGLCFPWAEVMDKTSLQRQSNKDQ